MNLHEQPAKPISFSPAMVEAILAGRKNQTRRIITGTALDWLINAEFTPEFVANPDNHLCPFGKPSSILWIREEHRIFDTVGTWHCEFKDGTITRHLESDIPADTLKRLKARKTLGKWQRARFLPRYFARTYLKVTDIQVERLQDISEEDAIGEGVQGEFDTWQDYGQKDEIGSFVMESARESFRTLWEKINGPGSWEANSWVWVVKFKKI